MTPPASTSLKVSGIASGVTSQAIPLGGNNTGANSAVQMGPGQLKVITGRVTEVSSGTATAQISWRRVSSSFILYVSEAEIPGSLVSPRISV